MKDKDFKEDVKDCIHYIDRNSYCCGMSVQQTNSGGKRYNCRKDGKCYWYKSQKDHEAEVRRSREERDIREYQRLKKKFDNTD